MSRPRMIEFLKKNKITPDIRCTEEDLKNLLRDEDLIESFENFIKAGEV